VANRFDHLLTRAIGLGNSGSPNGKRKLIKPALGNLSSVAAKAGGGRVSAATQAVTYVSEGQPLSIDWGAEQQARLAYLGQVYVMRGCRLIADTIAQLPWVAGPDPTDPSTYNKNASLARLLGPSTPQAPGGPNPYTNARTFWAWTIIQYIVTGRWAWECQLDGTGKDKEIIGLYPLVSAAIAPKPTQTGDRWFNGYEYTPATGVIELTDEQVIYNWRPSIVDWRLPESMLNSATYPTYIANAVDRYMANLLKNDLVATTLIVTPPIEEADQRRAWQDQFVSEFTGIQNTGKTLFAEVEADESDTGAGSRPSIQVERIATSPMDAGLAAAAEVAKTEICIALGVPKSLMGDASGSTFSNADAEWRNFWTTTLLDMICDLQDQVNQTLAQRLDGGKYVGWFDLSKVEALQPPSIFAPPMITDLIQTGVANADQIATMLNIPIDASNQDAQAAPRDSDTDSIMRQVFAELERRDHAQKTAPRNSYTIRGLEPQARPLPQRERIVVRAATKPAPKPLTRGIKQAAAIISHVEQIKATSAQAKDWELRSAIEELDGDELALDAL
jgi:HK97 family phage portal protein